MYIHNIHTYLEIFSIYYEVHSIIIVDGLKKFHSETFLRSFKESTNAFMRCLHKETFHKMQLLYHPYLYL